MPDLLLELFSEEIPARMQVAAAKDLERLVVGALSDRGLLFEGAKNFSGPRRLVLVIGGLPAAQRDLEEERKGPRVGAPEKAIEGFLRSAGVTLEQCVKESDGKGEFYVARIKRTGRPTAEVLSELLPEVFAKLPWPKSMRWPGSPVRWVRPLHAIVCTFDGEIVPFNFGGVESGRTTWGHRFLSQGPIEVRRYDDYAKKLRDAHVVLDADERRNIILHDMKQKTFAVGLEQIADEGLLQEVCGLAEWPVVYIGKIEDAFMDVPAEILQTAMRTHQKYFALRKPGETALANLFAFVANMVTEDGGAEIVFGNERVLRARLSDAKFFWEQDKKRTLESRVDDLKKIVFHAKLGTQYERVTRIEALAGEIAGKIGADVEKAKRAARLCKADLTTGVVGEFPELQGVMGRYFALNDGEDAVVADAIRDHYKPLGPNSEVPGSPVTAAVALADKLDQLVGFFAIGEKPTGSGDPYALRRAGLGIIRTLLQNRLRVSTQFLLESAAAEMAAGVKELIYDLTQFLAERLGVGLNERGIPRTTINAVFSLPGSGDLVSIVARVEALQTFLKTDDGANLLAGYRRAVNIVKAEEKKDKTAYEGEPDPKLLAEPEEIVLFREMAEARELIAAELTHERFTEAMIAMARLRGPVDAFFEKVTVNAPDPALRQNRLLLLSRLRASLHAVADFSKIEG
jgi:glycyl-tRNA synthetase beta chain